MRVVVQDEEDLTRPLRASSHAASKGSLHQIQPPSMDRQSTPGIPKNTEPTANAFRNHSSTHPDLPSLWSSPVEALRCRRENQTSEVAAVQLQSKGSARHHCRLFQRSYGVDLVNPALTSSQLGKSKVTNKIDSRRSDESSQLYHFDSSKITASDRRRSSACKSPDSLLCGQLKSLAASSEEQDRPAQLEPVRIAESGKRHGKTSNITQLVSSIKPSPSSAESGETARQSVGTLHGPRQSAEVFSRIGSSSWKPENNCEWVGEAAGHQYANLDGQLEPSSLRGKRKNRVEYATMNQNMLPSQSLESPPTRAMGHVASDSLDLAPNFQLPFPLMTPSIIDQQFAQVVSLEQKRARKLGAEYTMELNPLFCSIITLALAAGVEVIDPQDD